MSILHRLLDLLIFIGDEEEQIESLKFEAFQQKNFSCYVAFLRIDQQQKGFIKACDLQDFLFSNGYQSNGDASLKYISHYDIDEDDQLSLQEFEKALLPQSSSLFRQEILKRAPYNVIKKLPLKIEEGLFSIIKRQIQFYHKLLTKLAAIWVDFKLDFEQIFTSIDKKKLGYMNNTALQELFEDFGYNLYKDQIQFIMQKFDINQNGAMTLRDFSNLLFISDEIAEDILINQQSFQEFKTESKSSSQRNQGSKSASFYQGDYDLKNFDNFNNTNKSGIKSVEKRKDSLNTTTSSRRRITSLNKTSYQPNIISNLSTSFQIHLNETFSNACSNI